MGATLGEGHPLTLLSMNNFADFLQDLDPPEIKKAIELYKKAASKTFEVCGPCWLCMNSAHGLVNAMMNNGYPDDEVAPWLDLRNKIDDGLYAKDGVKTPSEYAE